MKAYEDQFGERAGEGATEHLVVVADRSASMGDSDFEPTRLDGLKDAGAALIAIKAGRAPQDQVAIVSYGSDATVEQGFITAGSGCKALQRSLRKITLAGGTSIGAGLEAAATLLQCPDASASGGDQITGLLKSLGRRLFDIAPGAQEPITESPDLSRILLLTDGHSNEGPCPRRVASRLKQQGVVIQAIGIGGTPEDVDEGLLKSIVSTDAAGNPQYLFIGAEQGTSTLIQAFEQRASYPKLM